MSGRIRNFCLLIIKDNLEIEPQRRLLLLPAACKAGSRMHARNSVPFSHICAVSLNNLSPVFYSRFRRFCNVFINLKEIALDNERRLQFWFNPNRFMNSRNVLCFLTLSHELEGISSLLFIGLESLDPSTSKFSLIHRTPARSVRWRRSRLH